MSLVVSEQPVGYAVDKRRMSAAEFLAWDEGQTVKHEFMRGEVFMMAGGEDRNDLLAGNLHIALRHRLRGTPCRVFGSDVELRVEAADDRTLPSLREYLLVDVDRRRCELYRIGADGLWVLHPGATGEGVRLESVALTAPGEALWADLETDAPPASV